MESTEESLRHRCFPVNLASFWRTPFLQKTSGILFLNRCNHQELLCKESVLTNFALQLYQKETSAQVFSWEFCNIFKKTYFIEHPLMAVTYWNKENIDQYMKWTIVLLLKIVTHNLLKSFSCFSKEFIKYRE